MRVSRKKNRLNSFFTFVGFAMTAAAALYGIFVYVGYQKEQAGLSVTAMDSRQTSQDSFTLEPVATLQPPVTISTPTPAGRTSRTPTAQRPTTYSAPTATEKEEAARLAWIAKRDSLEAVEKWRQKKVAAAKPAKRQAAAKPKAKANPKPETVTWKATDKNNSERFNYKIGEGGMSDLEKQAAGQSSGKQRDNSADLEQLKAETGKVRNQIVTYDQLPLWRKVVYGWGM